MPLYSPYNLRSSRISQANVSDAWKLLDQADEQGIQFPPLRHRLIAALEEHIDDLKDELRTIVAECKGNDLF